MELAPMPWADFAATWAGAAANFQPIYMLPGQWICDSAQQVPDDLEVHLANGCTITSTLPVTGGLANGVFCQNSPLGVSVAAITAPTAIGDLSFAVNTPGALSVGDWLCVVAGELQLHYQVTWIDGSTVYPGEDGESLPIMWALPAGAQVYKRKPARNIQIVGHGRAVITGTGDTAIRLSGLRHGRIEGIQFRCAAAAPSTNTIALDGGPYRSRVEFCEIGGGFGPQANQAALLIAGGEDVAVLDTRVYGSYLGLALVGCYGARVSGLRGTLGVRGLQARACAALRVTETLCDVNTSYGVDIEDGCSDVLVSQVHSVWNGNGGMEIYVGKDATRPVPSDVCLSNVCCSHSTGGENLGIGLYIGHGLRGVLASNLLLNDNAQRGAYISGDALLDGVESRDCGVRAVELFEGLVRISRCHLGAPAAPAAWQGCFVSYKASLHLHDALIEGSPSGPAIKHSSIGETRLDRVTATGAATGLEAHYGTIEIGQDVDLVGCATPIARDPHATFRPAVLGAVLPPAVVLSP